MPAPDKIKELVKKFENNINLYKSSKYNETTVREEFINPLFKELGWDVTNEGNVAPQYRDVILEDSIKIGNKTKAPDYSFTLSGRRIFFLEAKRPSIKISEDKSSAYQLKRYAWSAKLLLSVLTNFEELIVYEAKTRPDKNDHTKIGRVKLYNYKEYIDKWDEIYGLLSKEAIKSGNFDKYAESLSKKGTSQIDDEFLKEIEKWRELLAKKIASKNKNINLNELNYAVQQTIDRIIFLRMAEDKGIEPYEQLLKLLEHENIYEEFGKLCKKADAKYNAGLFHFKEEKDIDLSPDTYTLDLEINNNVFKTIIKDLYYPKSPYEFSVISPEILGNVYEQFIGKVIRFTPSKQVKIEEKPEVKKSGGVFYTPSYIVDFIIENTVAKLCKDKTPEQISKIKIVDPACGSGSFLLGAYDYLLKYHTDYYCKLKKTKPKKVPENTIFKYKDEYHLTIQKKKEILLNNIYGVDIDSQAVEVTKLSLLLKVLENENKDTIRTLTEYFNMRILPFLGNNIRCGNSLISTDIITEGQGSDMEIPPKKIPDINPFNWNDEFKEVFENGGFDAVIGNPPYFNIQTLGLKSKEVLYLKKKYNVYMDKTDILFYFIEKASQISKEYMGYIISNAFLFSDKGKELRNYIIDNSPIEKIVNFEKYLVFKAGITTAVSIFNKNQKTNQTKAITLSKKDYNQQELMNIINNENNYFDVEFSKNNVFSLIDNEIKAVNDKIDSNYPKLGELMLVGKGMETAANDVFLFKNYPPNFPKKFIKRRISGKNITKYNINNKTEFILYFECIDDFNQLSIEIQKYLLEHKDKLKNRADKKRRKTSQWWNYTFSLHKEYYDLPKIFCSYRAKENIFALDNGFDYIGFTNMTVIFQTNDKFSIKYILILLNSKLLNFRYKSIGKQTGGGSYEYVPNGVSKFPVPEISLKEQEPFIKLADKIINLNKELNNAKTPHDKKILEVQIIAIDKEIDKLVYDLYDLNQDEINIIENN
jgi:type I restriction-modification system DNA methylase subunit